MNLDEYFQHRFLDHRILELANSYLSGQGWFHSLAGEPKDAQGPVPWITYPALAMLKRIIRPEFKVFEYGSGNSTLWWSARVAEVVSVDHDRTWLDKIRPTVRANATLLHKEIHAPTPDVHSPVLDEFFRQAHDLPQSGNLAHDTANGLLCREFAAYAAALLDYPAGHFDVIVIDGMARTLTAWLAARQLGKTGMIIFDNSDRWQYNAAYRLLTDAGFAKIDFWGLGPVYGFEWCTSLFVRDLD